MDDVGIVDKEEKVDEKEKEVKVNKRNRFFILRYFTFLVQLSRIYECSNEPRCIALSQLKTEHGLGPRGDE